MASYTNAFKLFAENSINLDNDNAWASNSERLAGFVSGAIAKSKNVNSAIKSNSLVTMALMNLVAQYALTETDVNLGLASTPDQIKAAILSMLQNNFSFSKGVADNDGDVLSFALFGSTAKEIRALNVKNAKHADTADNADNADNATHANNADNAEHANNADNAINAYQANEATKLSSDAGSSIKPIYFSGGKPVASSSTVGGIASPVYLNGGTITTCPYITPKPYSINSTTYDSTGVFSKIFTFWPSYLVVYVEFSNSSYSGRIKSYIVPADFMAVDTTKYIGEYDRGPDGGSSAGFKAQFYRTSGPTALTLNIDMISNCKIIRIEAFA